MFRRRVRQSGKADTTDHSLIMRNHLLYLANILLIVITCTLAGCENAPMKKTEAPPAATISTETPLDKEITRLMEKGIAMSERKQQLPAIEAAFARRTTAERSRHLAALCYTKTLVTPFMPRDLAEIALAETGGHRLSSAAVSSEGALGVWQIMPRRARSHGYTAADMKNDEKCAEAAVRELRSKLEMAQGNLERAKKLYCGQGPQATAYLQKLRHIREEIEQHQTSERKTIAMDEQGSRIR
jgi:hypothetical protein